jgi:hypothetical protein
MTRHESTHPGRFPELIFCIILGLSPRVHLYAQNVRCFGIRYNVQLDAIARGFGNDSYFEANASKSTNEALIE